MTDTPYLTSKQVLAILKIKAESLYAYVSRGRIRKYGSNAQGESLFLKEDIEQFARSRKKAGKLATKGQLSFREAVIDSNLSNWSRKRAYYRGYPVQQFIDSDVPFENCAELLWQGKLAKKQVQWAPHKVSGSKVQPPKGPQGLSIWLAAVHHQISVCQDDPQVHDAAETMERAGATAQRGAKRSTSRMHYLARHTIWTMADTIGDNKRKKTRPPGVVALACERLGLNPAAKHLELLRRILIVAMDYQLSAPALIGRVAEGTEHTSSTALLLATIATAHSAEVESIVAADADYISPWFAQIKAWGQQQEEIGDNRGAKSDQPVRLSPYSSDTSDFPEGDPRVSTLMEWLAEHYRQRKSIGAILDHLEAYEQATGRGTDMATALALAAKALKISPTKVAGLFIMSRTAGLWGHLLEQAELPAIALPKARYRAAAQR